MANIELPSASSRRSLRRKLLAWFSRHARALPWRQTRDPYAIWVSEVMLQQTQVATVARYFKPFLRAFPGIDALAAASEQEVLRQWEGLGYYRRARDLAKAARILAAEHDARIPDDPAVLQRLPGFGRYTVGAVLSQAYGRRLPIVEANSRRVLCRLFGIENDSEKAASDLLWQLAERLLPGKHVGDFNQAMMELGALVCTPRQPECHACPLAQDCQARRVGRQRSIPARRQTCIEEQEEVAVVCKRRNQVLAVQRPATGRWARLWEFPHGPRNDGETPAAAALRLLKDLTGLTADVGEEILTIRHGVTRFRIRLTCLCARHRSGGFRSGFYPRARWVRVKQLSQMPFSAPQRRLAEAL